MRFVPIVVAVLGLLIGSISAFECYNCKGTDNECLTEPDSPNIPDRIKNCSAAPLSFGYNACKIETTQLTDASGTKTTEIIRGCAKMAEDQTITIDGGFKMLHHCTESLCNSAPDQTRFWAPLVVMVTVAINYIHAQRN